MQDSAFHVLLEGAQVGPYNRRTIVGMRIRNTLTSDDVVIANDGAKLTVADLIHRRPAEDFNANRSSVFSTVRATFSAALIEAGKGSHDIPRFQDEIELRVQTDSLRLAGRFRKGLGWKEDRIKIPLADIAHARVRGTFLDLWLRASESEPLQKLSLELFTMAAASELAEVLPETLPYRATSAPASEPASINANALWIAIAAIALVLGVVMIVLLWPRVR